MKYVCDIHCNECECRSAHETWHDTYSQGCKRCGSKDIGILKTYGHNKLRTTCQSCGKTYEGATWDDVPKSCCGEVTYPLGEMPPNYLKWYTGEYTAPSKGIIWKIIHTLLYGYNPT